LVLESTGGGNKGGGSFHRKPRRVTAETGPRPATVSIGDSYSSRVGTSNNNIWCRARLCFSRHIPFSMLLLTWNNLAFFRCRKFEIVATEHAFSPSRIPPRAIVRRLRCTEGQFYRGVKSCPQKNIGKVKLRARGISRNTTSSPRRHNKLNPRKGCLSMRSERASTPCACRL
jgi:hypothetical protein